MPIKNIQQIQLISQRLDFSASENLEKHTFYTFPVKKKKMNECGGQMHEENQLVSVFPCLIRV